MKKILIALAIATTAGSSVYAQKCTTVTKTVTTTTTVSNKAVAHKAPAKKATANHAVTKAELAQHQVCRMVPYNVYKIQPDRKTVMSYQTVDLDNLTPLNNTVKYYGPTDPLPDRNRVAAGTVIIGGKPKGEYCKRDDDNKQTTCFYNGNSLNRDADGNYSY